MDDDPDIRQVLMDRLTSYGYGVETAIDGLEALDAVKRGSYDGMLLDIRMPHVDGIEVLHQVKASYPAMPVIMITASKLQDTAAQALRDGACAFLLKPFDTALLKDAVYRCFGPAA